jgi:hypothetical protein
MKFITTKGMIIDIDPAKTTTMLTPRDDGAESILSRLTALELRSLLEWTTAQVKEPMQATNLANWPGWQSVASRLQLDTARAYEITSSLLARIASSRQL